MSEFWEGKQVIVTGARGFVGSFLVDMLVERGAHVEGMDTGVRGKNHNSYAHYADPRQADVTSQGNCAAVFRDADVVFNLAAHVGGLYHNIAHQAEQFWGNVQTLVPPALAAAKAEVPVYLQVSTVCCYAPGYNDPAQEQWGHIWEPEQANEGYAWAKRMGENACHWAFENAPTRYVIVRPTNIYGPRDYFDDTAHVIPALIRKFTDGRETVNVFGKLQSREFLYVEDVARGMLAVAEHGLRGEAYNLGTNGETKTSIAMLAQLVGRQTHFSGLLEFDEDAPTGDQSRSTDAGKANALGWRYTVPLEEGLQRTIEWWKEQQLSKVAILKVKDKDPVPGELRDGDVVIEAGAYEGAWVAKVAEQRPSCEIYAYEPATRAYKVAEKKLKGYPNVTLINAALGKQDGGCELYDCDRDGANLGWTRLEPCETVTVLDARRVRSLGEIALMHLNAEGGEIDILERLIDTGLIERARMILVQWHQSNDQMRARVSALTERLSETHKFEQRHYWGCWKRKNNDMRKGRACV